MSSEYSNALLVAMDEKEAERVSYSENKLTGEKILVRRFPVDSDADQSNGILLASRFVSTKNYDVNSDVHPLFNYVDDPLCDNVTYPGRWLLVNISKGAVKAGAGTQGVIETLISGTASTLTIEGFHISCDTVLNAYVSLRATDAEVATFIAAHPGADDLTGYIRTVNQTDRGNGFWDVMITEKITTYDAATHKITVVPHRGLFQTTTTVKGSSVPHDVDYSEQDLLAYIAKVAPTAVSATDVTRITDFSFNRNENCTFDFTYQIVTFIAGSSAVYQVMDNGIVRKYAKRYWNQYKNPAATPVASQPSVDPAHSDYSGKWPTVATAGNEQKIDIAQLEEVNGGLFNYTLILTELLMTGVNHVVDQQASTVYEENIAKSTAVAESGDYYSCRVWFMRRSRAITQLTTRVYSLNTLAKINTDVGSTELVRTQITIGLTTSDTGATIPAGSIINEREICGYDEGMGVHYKDRIKTILQPWSEPYLYLKKLATEGTTWSTHGGTTPWTAGSAGQGFP